MAEEGPSCPPPLASSRRDPAGGPDERAVRREVVGELGAALRDLVDAAVRTEVSAGELAAVAEAARELTARLRVAGRELNEVATVDDPDAGERWYSPVYGPGSPVAPPLVASDTSDGRATGRVTVGKPHEGPPGLVHGGVVATLLDHVLARAVRTAGRGGLTATLTVRYRRPVPLGVPLLVAAEMGQTEGPRTTATARLVAEDDPDTVLAEADGLFVALHPERSAQVFASMDRPVGAWTAHGGDD
ncbi:PaaI family thioesterase [Geodermatophilus sp. DF01-2]|uniref:PaaI family thioesterase n=1 Tax=Geodermatophilus sp. DF01-2 TaxID=2559610 RepID=UPI00107399D5|nr:PaaI family thioesterase [Geodermatophilus sp. DF01_2]TFV64517.1 PaaI family thioesterase [Geodermatophilus sp. DF01_2]